MGCGASADTSRVKKIAAEAPAKKEEPVKEAEEGTPDAAGDDNMHLETGIKPAMPTPEAAVPTKCQRTVKGNRVFVVGSINVDLYQRVNADAGYVRFGGVPIDVTPIKGQTLPAVSFMQNAKIASQLLSTAGLAGTEEVDPHHTLRDNPKSPRTSTTNTKG